MPRRLLQLLASSLQTTPGSVGLLAPVSLEVGLSIGLDGGRQVLGRCRMVGCDFLGSFLRLLRRPDQSLQAPSLRQV